MDKQEQQRRVQIVVDNYDGILPYFEAFYIHSIIYAAAQAEMAFDGYERAVAEEQPPEIIFSEVQEGLAHSAALSRFFWPVRKRNTLSDARGTNLRNAFGLDVASPLKDRDLRNAFEHFDEDLDRFLLANDTGYFFPAPMIDDHTLADEQLGKIFKLVDPAHHVCVLLGRKFDFKSIRAEVKKVLNQALEMDQNGSRLRDPKSL
ncbi:hypothetical protein [Stappia sp. ICDLI1TA098]